MSDLLQSESFLTWTKGPAALDAMKKSLCGHIRSVWIDFLDSLDHDEIEHLQQFIEDLNNDLVEADKKRKEWIFHCQHERCKSLLQKLTAIRYNQKSLNIVWNTSCKTTQRRAGEDLIGLAQIFEYHRTICKTFYWHVANTFMLYGTERNEMRNTCPDDTDVALVLKMMKNCTLFETDENELYAKIIDIRNRIFHTGQYNMTEQEMGSYIDKMTELLQQIHGLSNCMEKWKSDISSGIAELNDIKGRNLVSISLQRGWKSMAVEALQLQRQAIEWDIQFRGTVALDTKALESILTSTNDKILEYTDSAKWKRPQDEKRKQEEEIRELTKKIDDLKDQLKRESEKARDLDRQNYTLRLEKENLSRERERADRQNENLRQENKDLRKEASSESERARDLDRQNATLYQENRNLTWQINFGRDANLAGQWSEGGAEALDRLGPLGRAAGAVVGGAAGTVAEGGKKLIDRIFY